MVNGKKHSLGDQIVMNGEKKHSSAKHSSADDK